MSNILDKHLVLSLNSNWVVIGTRSVREAVICLCSESNGQKPALALDIEMVVNAVTGGNELVYANPVSWDDWINLPVRDCDLSISTSRGLIRVPTVLICAHYSKVPLHRPRWSTGNVHARDDYICGYTGKKLSRAQATVDHIIPRSRGGKDEWTNTITCDKKVNSMKGARTPEEAGLTPIRVPKAPLALPMNLVIRRAERPEWGPFLVN